MSWACSVRYVATSFFLPPNSLQLNRLLKNHPTRLKYELAVHIGHAVLHNKDGVKSGMSVGGAPDSYGSDSPDMAPQDILHAWRDFESSFFCRCAVVSETTLPAIVGPARL